MRNKSVLSILSIALLLAIHIAPFASTESSEGTTPVSMTRIMMFPPNAEVTGIHIDANGNFFVNAMHPDDDNYIATIGVINGIDWNELPSSVPELASSSSESDIWHGIRTSYGDYQVLLQSGDALSEGGVAGGIYAADDGNSIFISEKPDYNAFVPLNADGSRGYLYTAWEERPAGISQLEIEWNTASTEWDVLGGMMLDLSSVNGGWVLCFGSMSPWETPLLAEELYFSNTQSWNDETYNYHYDQERLEDYLGYYPNPYDYGYIMEIENSATTDPDFIKHFAMGRFSHENAQVMPDERTVYLSDDGYDTVLFKFVADAARDLSSGTLYAAKVTQDDSRDSATTGFDVEWMEMASSSNSVIQTWIDEYDGITTADFIAGQNSYITDEEIRDWAEGRLNDDLNGDGTIGYAADDRVAFLESRKAAAALGASDEWNKMEGVGFNPNAPDYLYLAMSDVGYDMSDGQGDIDVTQNRCGIVYRMTLDDEWNVNRIEPVISGGPYTSSATYECDVNNLAGPDNLAVLDDGRVLIGEDTGKHEDNMVWLWESTAEPEISDGEGGNGGEGSGTGNGSETITVNHVVLVDTPLHPEWEWNYSYQVEVSDLQMDVNYTAVIGIYRLEDMDWEGLDWWWDIDWEGGYDEDNDGYHNQYNFTFSLQSGCYHINADLYESNGDIENSAPVGSPGDLDFGVGGICMDGVFSSVFDSDEDGIIDKLDYCPDTSQGETVNARGCSNTQLPETGEGGDDDDATSIPGFGLLLSITAALGAALVATRRE
ncbi:MAG: hypothetical protein CXX80_03630 [Methanobacteriota archaeon]|nr:MAG: hypothetical protein CXX80_03630 [Euryarchaeota archaeon]